jgi:hypothetical protein
LFGRCKAVASTLSGREGRRVRWRIEAVVLAELYCAGTIAWIKSGYGLTCLWVMMLS